MPEWDPCVLNANIIHADLQKSDEHMRQGRGIFSPSKDITEYIWLFYIYLIWLCGLKLFWVVVKSSPECRKCSTVDFKMSMGGGGGGSHICRWSLDTPGVSLAIPPKQKSYSALYGYILLNR